MVYKPSLMRKLRYANEDPSGDQVSSPATCVAMRSGTSNVGPERRFRSPTFQLEPEEVAT